MTVHGTYRIGLEVQKQPEFYWIFAGPCGQRTRVWLTWEGLGTSKKSAGRSKPSVGMQRTGSTKKEGPMQSEVARGFLMLLLNNEQKEWLKTMETLHQRHLVPGELYHQFPEIAKKTISPEQEAEMKNCWGQFYKTHQGQSWWTDEVRSLWDDWVMKNYREPLPTIGASASVWGTDD